LAPLALLVAIGLYKRHLDRVEHNALPTYLASRTVHVLVHEWNEAQALLSDLRKEWGWSWPLDDEVTKIASTLEPNVGRVRATGLWQPRPSRRRRIDPLALQAAQAQWADTRRRLAAALTDELGRRVQAHTRILDGLRSRGLSSVVPTPLPQRTDWPRLVAHIQRVRDETRLAVQEAVELLRRAQDPAPSVGPVLRDAQALLDAGKHGEAADVLLRLQPVASQRNRGL
jgi:hypothetical protein